jgi:quinoprotein relay system zinc metallohydrolase 1
MTLDRRAALGLIAAAPVVAAAPRAWAQALDYALSPAQVAPGIWMVEGVRDHFSKANGGNIGNTVFIETDAGLLVIDTGSSLRYGEALRAAAQAATGRQVAEVWNTHHHPDHFLGNGAFADLPIRALPDTAGLAASHGDGYADALYRLLGDWMRGTSPQPPDGSLAAGERVLGGRRFRLLAMAGHSQADLAVLDEETGTLVAADLVFLDRAASTPDAELSVWRDSLAALRALAPAATLPGHGPVDRGGTSYDQTRGYLEWLETTLREAVSGGLDMMEAMAAPMPEAHARLGAQPTEFSRSVIHLYPRLEAELLPVAAPASR